MQSCMRTTKYNAYIMEFFRASACFPLLVLDAAAAAPRNLSLYKLIKVSGKKTWLISRFSVAEKYF